MTGIWIRLFVAVLALPLTAMTASAQVRFANLSDRDIYVSKGTYTRDSASGPSGSSTLAVIREGRWTFEGRFVIPSGGTWEGPEAYYHIDSVNGPVFFDGLSKGRGFTKPGQFGMQVGENWDSSREQRIVNDGYRTAEYQYFKRSNNTINGNAYRLQEKSFPFNFQSLEVKSHEQRFTVPGPVAFVNIDADQRPAPAPPIGRKIEGQNVTLMAITGGTLMLDGRREKGYARGTVTVTYFVRP